MERITGDGRLTERCANTGNGTNDTFVRPRASGTTSAEGDQDATLPSGPPAARSKRYPDRLPRATTGIRLGQRAVGGPQSASEQLNMNQSLSSPHRDDHGPGALPMPAYFRIRDVMRITGLSRPTLYRRIAANRFPQSVHLGGRACGWPSAALQAWINDPEGYNCNSTAVPATTRSRDHPRKHRR